MTLNCCVYALLVWSWSSLYSSWNWQNGLDTIATCILEWYDCVYKLDLRAMKHFTYGCLQMANILHCIFHFVPKRICVHVCSKYVAVFSIFNQFHIPICWLCLNILAESINGRINANTDTNTLPYKFNSHCIDCWFVSNEMQIMKSTLLSLHGLCVCVVWNECFSRQ